ncbi:rhodanese-like domain-containing protein [Lapidilactobacillus luobeiensis]|uniref:rhodanese-like domain-containing protein n=1 Tax=Lapidilactobacillus luobeiensis TaxID=2950371 RepID=UPI0021C450F5|nr:rhodanese-like domain-containing protein [Lapidilactobacillus luobeiensis]
MILLAANTNKGFLVLNTILLGIILWMVGNWAYYKIRGKRLHGALTPEEFEKTMRKAQLIDIREKKDYKAGHILGARNFPYTQIKSWQTELRQDMPVYLYETGENMSIRIALRLKKAGYPEVKWLKGGYGDWKGKTKKETAD